MGRGQQDYTSMLNPHRTLQFHPFILKNFLSENNPNVNTDHLSSQWLIKSLLIAMLSSTQFIFVISYSFSRWFMLFNQLLLLLYICDIQQLLFIIYNISN